MEGMNLEREGGREGEREREREGGREGGREGELCCKIHFQELELQSLTSDTASYCSTSLTYI